MSGRFGVKKTAAWGMGCVLVSGALIGAGGIASADLVTRCVGEGGAVTVPGDLVVPKGKTCALDGTVVEGDVRVARGADLIASEAEFHGAVRLAEDAYFNAERTSIDGALVSRAGFGAYLFDSEVGGDVVQREVEGSQVVGFAYLDESTTGGDVRANTGEVFLSGATVRGDVRGTDADYVDVVDSVVDGGLTAARNTYGSVVCDSEIYGDATIRGNSDLVQLGAHEPVGPCSGATYWGGDLTVSGNEAEVVVSNNIVRGDLGGTRNAPAPTGENNRVRGEVTGQFADLAPLGGNDAGARTLVAAPDRDDTTRADARKRAALATNAAEAAGPASL